MRGTRVRVACPDDTPAVAAIGRRAVPTQYAGLVDSAAVEAAVEQSYSYDALEGCIRRCRAAGDAHFLVAEHDARVIGFLHFDSFGREPELHRLYVSEDARRRGAGALLMDALHERIGPACGYMLLVVSGNDRAVSFYERRGLRVTEAVDGLTYYSRHMGVTFAPGTQTFRLLVMRREPVQHAHSEPSAISPPRRPRPAGPA